MAAPFDLPDRASLFLDGHTEPYATDVPCRQVPTYARGGGTRYESDVALYTHWVDFEVDVPIRDEANISFPTQDLDEAGDRIEIVTETSLLSLTVLWVEDRFSNTEDCYLRAYCTRITRVVGG